MASLQVPPVVPYKALGNFPKALYGTTGGTCSARFSRPVMQAFASMRALHSFLRAVINFLMRAESTFEITNGEQFSTSWNLSLLKRCFARSNLANTFKTGQQAQS